MIGLKKDGQKVSTPNLSSLIEDDITEAIRRGEKSFEEDWKATPEVTPCGVCKGSGYDTEEKMTCMGCDGSGRDYELHYGIEDKNIYAYVVQYGLDGFKEYCKAMREAEVDSVRVKSALVPAFALPAFARIDMMAEGIPVDEMVHSGNVREIANMVFERYPEFMLTNLTRF